METPVCDFVLSYKEKKAVRAHMPGHKGVGSGFCEELDITEIDGADVLYKSHGIIRQSEENAAKLFGTGRTVYSVEGSSLSIRAMLYLVALYAKETGRKPLIFAARNAHRVFGSAAALLSIDVKWIFPLEGSVVSCRLSAERLESIFENAKEKPTALFITSPDYLGRIADVKALSEVCRRHGVLLLVDNAHGAYLRFLERDIHPITLGADLCCDSAHKTLPALTGCGYLHISKDAPSVFFENAENAMSLFASTSPSYLLIQSLDALNKRLDGDFGKDLARAVKRLDALKNSLSQKGWQSVGEDKLRLTLDCRSRKTTGTQTAEQLKHHNIFVEYSDRDYAVLMFSPYNSESDYALVESALSLVEKKECTVPPMPVLTEPKKALSPSEVLFMPSEKVRIEEAEGRILSRESITCPPAIQIVSPGEIINESCIELFRCCGIEEVWVI